MSNPYDELIQRMEQSIQALVRSNFARDARRQRLEDKKVLLLTLCLISMWIMFFLLWEKPDDATPREPVASPSHDTQPHFQIRDEEPEAVV